MQSQYKIAVIDENNEIIKIYTKKEYDSFILKSYERQQLTVSSIPIPHEKIVYNELIASNPKTQSVDISPAKMLQNDTYKFQGIAVILVLAMITMLLGNAVYKSSTGKDLSGEFVKFFIVLCVGLAFYFLFLK